MPKFQVNGIVDFVQIKFPSRGMPQLEHSMAKFTVRRFKAFWSFSRVGPCNSSSGSKTIYRWTFLGKDNGSRMHLTQTSGEGFCIEFEMDREEMVDFWLIDFKEFANLEEKVILFRWNGADLTMMATKN